MYVLRSFCELLVSEGNSVGMNISECSTVIDVDARRFNNIEREIERMKGCNLLIVIVPDRGEVYGNVMISQLIIHNVTK
jgi:hypothetical protein